MKSFQFLVLICGLLQMLIMDPRWRYPNCKRIYQLLFSDENCLDILTRTSKNLVEPESYYWVAFCLTFKFQTISSQLFDTLLSNSNNSWGYNMQEKWLLDQEKPYSWMKYPQGSIAPLHSKLWNVCGILFIKWMLLY